MQSIKTIMDSLSQGALLVNKNGDITYANVPIMQFLGYQKDELLSNSFFDINPHFSKMGWKKLWTELNTNKEVSDQTQLITASSIIFPIESTALLVEADKKPYCLYLARTKHQKASYEQMINSLSSIAKIGSWRWDLVRKDFTYTDTTFTLFNRPEGKEVTAREAFKILSEVLLDESFDLFKKNLSKAIETGDEFNFETTLKEDPDKQFTTTLKTLYTEEKTAVVFGTFQDISKLAKRSKEMIKSEFTLDNAREMIFWVDRDAQVKFVNQMVCDKLGYTRDELLTKKVFDFTNTPPEAWDDIWKAMKGKKHEKLSETFITNKGENIPVDLDVNHITHKGVEYHCTYAQDISEIIEKENELQRAFDEISLLNDKLTQEKTLLLNEISEEYNFNDIITQSNEYKETLTNVVQVADTDTSVLIYGETGTGKELLARAIHNLSDRNDQPMIKINCAAIPANLIESELFGHEKGAFTGAHTAKPGKFEMAHGSTIFLDEIGELPLDLQSKLLRVLQEGEFERLGSVTTKTVDVRVIAATNRDLTQMIDDGKFREDLFFRLNVFPILNLPLRDRKEDIPLLVKFFMDKYSKKMNKNVTKVSESQLSKLMDYSFPGNIRELENLVERALIYSKGNTLNLSAVLPELFKRAKVTGPKVFLSFEEHQRQHIIAALEKTGWKISGKNSASELLKINGKTLASKIRKLGISRFSDN